MSTKSTSTQSESWYSTHNPLLLGLPNISDLSEMYEVLGFHPLRGIDLGKLSFADRDALLTGEKVPLEPTMQSVRAAMTWWGMLISGLRARNPTMASNKANYWTTLNAASQGAQSLLPSPTSGISINVTKGPSGTGKTVTQQRLCAYLPQIIDHGRQESAGWNSMRQLVYLNLMISHDGTRGGFLQSILLQMDAALGTSYSTDLPRRYKTVEKLAVATIGRLIAHYCGILFVDEAQLRNLVESGQAEIMQMFLLLLMNSGIPLVLTGNERAFNWVTYSQDLTRLSLTQQSVFSPIGAISRPEPGAVNFEWEAVAEGVMSYYVLREAVSDFKGCSTLLRRLSGGIARLALILWCNAQRNSLFDGRETIGPTDIQKVYDADDFARLRPLAEGFHFRKPELLKLFPDVDADFYSLHWGVPLEADTRSEKKNPQEISKNKALNIPKLKIKTTGAEKLKREQTRLLNEAKKRAQALANLGEDDIRKAGLIEHHLEGLASATNAAKKVN